MHFANCAALAAILFTTLIKNFETLLFCPGWVVLNLFLNVEQKSVFKILFL